MIEWLKEHGGHEDINLLEEFVMVEKKRGNPREPVINLALWNDC